MYIFGAWFSCILFLKLNFHFLQKIFCQLVLMLLIADDLLYMLPSLTCALNVLPVHLLLCILANSWYSRDVWFQQRQVWLLDFGNFPLTSQAYSILFTYRNCTMDILLMFIPQAVGMFGNILWYWTQRVSFRSLCAASRGIMYIATISTVEILFVRLQFLI